MHTLSENRPPTDLDAVRQVAQEAERLCTENQKSSFRLLKTAQLKEILTALDNAQEFSRTPAYLPDYSTSIELIERELTRRGDPTQKMREILAQRA